MALWFELPGLSSGAAQRQIQHKNGRRPSFQLFSASLAIETLQMGSSTQRI
jgi:hypothetical protein